MSAPTSQLIADVLRALEIDLSTPLVIETGVPVAGSPLRLSVQVRLLPRVEAVALARRLSERDGWMMTRYGAATAVHLIADGPLGQAHVSVRVIIERPSPPSDIYVPELDDVVVTR